MIQCGVTRFKALVAKVSGLSILPRQGQQIAESLSSSKRLVPLLTDVNQSLHQNLGMLVSDALKNLQYRDDADLLSMHACLLDNYEVQCILRSKPQGWCKRNRKVLKAAMEEYFGKHGIYPHPVVLFKKYAHLP